MADILISIQLVEDNNRQILCFDGIGDGMKRQDLVKIIITLLICFVLLFSAFFVTIEAGHSCSDPSCRTCIQMEACATILTSVLAGFLLLKLLLIFISEERKKILCFCNAKPCRTLTSLKIKLRN